MPAKLSLSSIFTVNSTTTPLVFNNTTQGYLTGGMSLNGSGQLVVSQTKLYYVNATVTIEQNSVNVNNVAYLNVFQNGVNVLKGYKSYNVNDPLTFSINAYLNLNAGDVISANIEFANVPANQIQVYAFPISTYLNVV